MIAGVAEHVLVTGDDLIVKTGLLHKGEDVANPVETHFVNADLPATGAVPVPAFVIVHIAGGKGAVCVQMVVQSRAQLLQIVFAGGAASSFAGLLNSWQQQSHKNRNDRDDYQQFNKSECVSHHEGVRTFDLHHTFQKHFHCRFAVTEKSVRGASIGSVELAQSPRVNAGTQGQVNVFALVSDMLCLLTRLIASQSRLLSGEVELNTNLIR